MTKYFITDYNEKSRFDEQCHDESYLISKGLSQEEVFKIEKIEYGFDLTNNEFKDGYTFFRSFQETYAIAIDDDIIHINSLFNENHFNIFNFINSSIGSSCIRDFKYIIYIISEYLKINKTSKLIINEQKLLNHFNLENIDHQSMIKNLINGYEILFCDNMLIFNRNKDSDAI